MQVEKVVIASVLILTACAKVLPEGKDCVLKCVSAVKFLQMLSAILKCGKISVVHVLTMCNVSTLL